MKSITITITALFLFRSIGFSQITKGNWMVGGNANVSLQKEKLFQSDITGWGIKVLPDIGFFIADKVAGGLKANFNYASVKLNGNISKTTYLGIGPFFRYYFLPVDNRVNVFAESAYQRGTDFNGHGENNFSFSAGPVIYFNTSIGLEFTLNYNTEKGNLSPSIFSVNTFSLGIGFQIHLEKDKD